ncbi:glycoside hydrolase family 12 protein [Bipolaris maydis ATCC 48331]|uniref:Glycoside hydrolase family 12 protein n=2 Tax=Cochliobolus heterostrophus TaxID=5016 RepID=M2UMM9_COCH5|nr:glycoside hydrolase family 12 protein [Bipolaris maydis ATCC 48331]EMD94846.1 glycoside hydrolase family 12 protein [Bipolaris maydis C5]KAH7555969.1 glycoside hydrolase family 12 protein [Bipolaris maydis]ENI01862.1 glycoside hydrolase family 12 protein [Bipolaris maydis ATCC 48331]KAJ5029248.1 glycoside hydrolase [Bipolaris maydis]KAJ5062015.1 endoglucanase A precursor [Bipolaris maydis]
MKFSVFLAASSASLALAVPASSIQKRADFCDQWGSQVNGAYTTYNNLWGKADATSGSQCTGVDGLSGNTLKWHTSWSWAGGQGKVKSFANVVTNINKKSLASIKSLPSVWQWTYTGNNIIADVAYDLFTSSTPTGSEEYEVMIWLAALGGAGPISATGSPIATVTLAGNSWKLYNGKNGQMNVFSFVAEKQVQNFSGDLMDFLKYLTSKQGLPSSQILISAGAGTEPFSGSNAKFVTSAFSLAEN